MDRITHKQLYHQFKMYCVTHGFVIGFRKGMVSLDNYLGHWRFCLNTKDHCEDHPFSNMSYTTREMYNILYHANNTIWAHKRIRETMKEAGIKPPMESD